MQLNGNMVAGKKIELIIKDDTGVADVTRRHAKTKMAMRNGAALALASQRSSLLDASGGSG